MTTRNRRWPGRTRLRTPLVLVFLALFPLYGGYYCFSVFLCGAVLAVLVLACAYRDGRFRFPNDAAAWCLYGVCFCHLLSIPFAVSSGRAFAGFLRTLVWVLFEIYISNCSDEDRPGILDAISYEGAVLAFLSTAAFLYTRFTGGEDLNSRLDGFFEYANTWALYQLVCIVLLAFKEKRKPVDYLSMAVLTLGVFLTGSRGVILLMTLAAVLGGIHAAVKSKKAIWAILAATVIIAAAFAASLLTKGAVLDRIRAISISSSSMNGRLLYWLDGIDILRAHPFGIGYGGYIYMQSAIQTGVYTVRYVHNDYLQAALDGGILAGVLLLVFVCISISRKGLSLRERTVMLLIAFHCFIDFDLQFSGVMLLFLLCGKGNKAASLSLRRKAPAAVCAFAVILCFAYFANVYYFDFRGGSLQSWQLFPADLELAEKHLAETYSQASSEEYADSIIASTDYSELAWHRKYLAAVQRGDLRGMLTAKYQYLLLNRYRSKVWNDFTVLLEDAAPSPEDEALITEYARTASEELERTIRRTRPLAWKISEKPDFSFSEDILRRLSELEAGS